MRPSSVRACVQEPIALVSDYFASPKMAGPKKGQILFRTQFSQRNRAILFREKALIRKMCYLFSRRESLFRSKAMIRSTHFLKCVHLHTKTVSEMKYRF